MTIWILVLLLGQYQCERVVDFLADCQPYVMRLSCCEQLATRFCSAWTAPVIELPRRCGP